MAKKSDDILFVDTETTGLVEAIGTSLFHQPYIIELCIIRTNKNLKPQRVLSALIRPPIPIEPHITRITGITNEMVETAPEFADVYKEAKSISKGAARFVAQNLMFDKALLEFETTRLGKKPIIAKDIDLFCTVEQAMHLNGFRMNSKELHAAAGKGEIKGIHRAKSDVLAMIEYYRYIVSETLPKHLRRRKKACY